MWDVNSTDNKDQSDLTLQDELQLCKNGIFFLVQVSPRILDSSSDALGLGTTASSHGERSLVCEQKRCGKTFGSSLAHTVTCTWRKITLI